MTKTIEVSAGVITRLFIEFGLIRKTNQAISLPVTRAMDETVNNNVAVSKKIDSLVAEVRNRHWDRDENGEFKISTPSVIVPLNPEEKKDQPKHDEPVYLTSKEEFMKDMEAVQETLHKFKVTKIPIAATNNLMLDTRLSSFQVFNSLMVYDG